MQAQSDFFDPYRIRVVISCTTSYILKQTDLVVKPIVFQVQSGHHARAEDHSLDSKNTQGT